MDSAPDKLVQVVGYLQSVTDKIDIALVTVAGTWTTIAARIFSPVLLALTLLAVRNHVKR